jgi:RNA polymerase sigma-70 factor (ECF subfamily)
MVRDDIDLIRRLRRGETSAFDEVYAAHKDRIYGLLLRLSRDAATAADLYQNVWLKLARHARELRDDSNLGAWLCTVARREYISFRRAEALDLSRVLLLGRARDEAAPERLDEDLAIQRALGGLSDPDREVLLLSVSGLDPERVAETVGVSAVALRQRLARARRRLTLLLESEPVAMETGDAKGARR